MNNFFKYQLSSRLLKKIFNNYYPFLYNSTKIRFFYVQNKYSRGDNNLFYKKYSESSKLNIKINHQLNDSTTLLELQNVFNKFKKDFNLINYSTLIRKSSFQIIQGQQVQNVDNNQIFLKQMFSDLLPFIQAQSLNENDARSIANLFYSCVKFISRPEVDMIFLQQVIDLLENRVLQLYKFMNDQEISNVIYALQKLKKRQTIMQLCPHLAETITKKFNFRSVILIYYSISVAEINYPKLIHVINDYYSQNSYLLERINSKDFADLIYCYSKNKKQVQNLQVIYKLEQLSNKILHNVNYLLLANIFNSLANFDKPIFSVTFYTKFEVKIIELINEIPLRALSNILRGYATYNQGTDTLYKALEKRAITLIKQYNVKDVLALHNNAKKTNNIEVEDNNQLFDLESFSTIFYFFAKNNQGSIEFYKKMDEVIKELNIVDLTTKQFQYIFFSISHIKDNFEFSDKSKENLLKFIILKKKCFSIEEIGSLMSLTGNIFGKSQDVYLQLIESLQLQKNQLKETADLKPISEILLALQLNFKQIKNILDNIDFLVEKYHQITTKLLDSAQDIVEEDQKEIKVNQLTRIVYVLNKNIGYQNQFVQSGVSLIIKLIGEQESQLVKTMNDKNKYYYTEAIKLKTQLK